PQEQLAAVIRRHRLTSMETPGGCFQLPMLVDSTIPEDHPLTLIGTVEAQTDGDAFTVATLMQSLREHRYRLSRASVSVAPEKLRAEVADASDDQRQITASIQRFTALRIRQRLEETLELPPFPATAEKILRLRGNPNASAMELTRIVESDPSLSAQVVSWAASPYYAAAGSIDSVHDAIVRVLGFELVSNLAVGLILGRTVSEPGERVYGDTPYWLQAAYCATAVESLVRLLPPGKRPVHGLAYLSGLLHNFGYLVLAHLFPPHFSRICRYAEANPSISHVAIDHHLVGLSREQISAWLMQCWSMPEELSVALRWQHDPEYDGNHAVYAHLILIALRLLREYGIGDAPPERVPDALYERYRLDPRDADEAIARVAGSPDIPVMAKQLGS
ncbi:MAG: HDOD domain-containing protein, partial [Pseudomonadota bacterium]